MPGLGQLCRGARAEGLATLCLTTGLWFGMALAAIGPAYMRSWFTLLVLGITYLFVLIPAVTGAAQRLMAVSNCSDCRK